MSEELDERELEAIVEENFGNPHVRRLKIAERAFDAKIAAAQKEEPLCEFKNENGWCKLALNHKGKHTVIYLGED